jgi:hypothetical protein
MGDHLERAEIGRGGLVIARPRACSAGCGSSTSRPLAPVARGRLEQQRGEFVSLNGSRAQNSECQGSGHIHANGRRPRPCSPHRRRGRRHAAPGEPSRDAAEGLGASGDVIAADGDGAGRPATACTRCSPVRCTSRQTVRPYRFVGDATTGSLNAGLVGVPPCLASPTGPSPFSVKRVWPSPGSVARREP